MRERTNIRKESKRQDFAIWAVLKACVLLLLSYAVGCGSKSWEFLKVSNDVYYNKGTYADFCKFTLKWS